MSAKKALLAGASGLIGGYCLQYLLQDPNYSRIILLTRNKLPVDHPKCEQHQVEFNELSGYAKVMTADHVFCCLGTTMKNAGSREAFRRVDFEYPLEIARITRQNGAGTFLLVSALNADPNSKIFYNRVKGEVEEAIQALNFPTTFIFRPSLLLGERKENRPGRKSAVFF